MTSRRPLRLALSIISRKYPWRYPKLFSQIVQVPPFRMQPQHLLFYIGIFVCFVPFQLDRSSLKVGTMFNHIWLAQILDFLACRRCSISTWWIKVNKHQKNPPDTTTTAMQVWTEGTVNLLGLSIFQQPYLVALLYILHCASGFIIMECLPPNTAPILAHGHILESKGSKCQLPQNLMTLKPAFLGVKWYHFTPGVSRGMVGNG